MKTVLKDFVKNEVEPQAMENDKNETFNVELFKYLLFCGFLLKKNG